MLKETENNKRVAKNTLLLYLRMFLMTCISLYTSRIMLQALGVANLGIYNVVGGVVGLMSILNGAMAVSTQRYLSFGLGQRDLRKLSEVFTTCFIIYALLCAILFVLAETLGLWIVNTQLVIEPDRLVAANWVYQFSIITCVTSLLVSPYNAAIIAHEKMSIYAYFSIINAILQLLIVYLIQVLPIDVLISYGALLMLVSLVNTSFNWIYCIRKFPECKIISYFDKAKFKELLSYSGWNLFGSMSGVLRVQGISVLLNLFFTPAVNAAMAIAAQVNSKVEMFFTNFMVAVRPQIIKYYAEGDMDGMIRLVTRSSKFAFYLIFLIGLPIFIESSYIINLWLGQLPEYVVPFVRLMIILSAVESMTQPIMTAAHATGRIKFYQVTVGSIMLLNLPIAYVCLELGADPYSVIIVSIGLSVFCTFLRVWVLKRLMPFPAMKYFKNAYIKPIIVAVTASIIPVALHLFLDATFFNVILICLLCLICTFISIYVLGLTTGERTYITTIILSKFKRNGENCAQR